LHNKKFNWEVVKAITLQALAFFCLFEVCLSHAFGQDSSEVDRSAVIEVGGAGEMDLRGSSSNFGATLAIEKTPIEHWLELEFGVTVLATSGETELETDLLFKKPYSFSSTAEFMIGAGPDVVRKFDAGEHSTSLGVEAVLDFMFWPANNIGWYLEPSYGYLFERGAERSLGISAGLLVGWP